MNKKDKYKRRSSILKTGKSISEDKDTDCVPITPERTEKRVSFAYSNFIKPFASGPENNTVWDTTIEEAVNFTDPTPPDHNTYNVSGNISKNSTKNETTSEMELTRLSAKSDIVQCAKLMGSIINDKENFIDSQMDFTCAFKSQNSTTVTSHIQRYTEHDINNISTKTVTENDFDSTKNTKTQEMELTRLSRMKNKKVSVKSDIVQCAKLMRLNITDKENFIDSQMDFTCAVSTTVSSNFQRYTEHDINRVSTTTVAENDFDSTKNTKTQEMELTRLAAKSDIVQCAKLMGPNVNDKENFIDSQMDFTCAVSTTENSNFKRYTEHDMNNVSTKTVTENDFDSTKNTKTQEMELTRLPKMQDKNVSVKSDIVQCAKLMGRNVNDKENFIDSQMDFTCAVPTTVSSNFQVYTEQDGSKSELMELTKNNSLIGNLEKNDVSYNISECNADTKTQVMDFTLINPINKTLQNETVNQSRKSNLVEYVKSLKRVSNDNETNCNESQMEFTCKFENTTRMPNFEVYTEPDVSETQEMELESQVETVSQKSNIALSEITLTPKMDNNTSRVSNFEVYTEPDISDFPEVELKSQVETFSQKSVLSELPIQCKIDTEIEILDKENVPFKNVPDEKSQKHFTGEYAVPENVFPLNYKGTTFDNSLKLVPKYDRHAHTILEPDITNEGNLNFQDYVQSTNSNANDIKAIEESNSQLHNALFPTEEMCSPGNVLFSQKIVRPNTSSVKLTPNSSFQMSLPTTSPCVDDTQHLIHCTYIKTFSDSALSNKQQSEKSYLNENSKLIETERSDLTKILPKRSKLSTVNDTYCLIAKPVEDDVQNDESLGVLSTSLIDKELIGKCSDSKLCLPSLMNESIDKPFEPKLPLATCNYKLPKVDSDLIAKVNAQSELIRKKIESFEFKKLVSPIFEPFDFKLVYVDQEEEIIGEIDGKSPVEHSLHEKILNRQGSHQNWKYMKQDGNLYYFSNFCEKLEFIAHVNETTGLVRNVEIKPVSDTISLPGLFAAKCFIHRIENIASAIGNKYDLMSLLDYVEITTSNIIDVIIKLDVIGPAVQLEFNSDATVATFSVVSFFLMTEFKVSVDLKDVDNINKENVSIDTVMGTNRSEIENLAKNSKKGICFLPSFITSITEYVDLKEEIYLNNRM